MAELCLTEKSKCEHFKPYKDDKYKCELIKNKGLTPSQPKILKNIPQIYCPIAGHNRDGIILNYFILSKYEPQQIAWKKISKISI